MWWAAWPSSTTTSDAILPIATAEEKEKYKAIKKAQAEKAAAAKAAAAKAADETAGTAQ